MIDCRTDTGAYILGVLWGTMSEWEDGFWLRHRDRFFLSAVRDYMKIGTGIQVIASRSGPQYRIKIVRKKTVEEMCTLLHGYGWKPRNAAERTYPNGEINHRGFIRAWVELHATADIRQSKNRNGTYSPQKRLRIYGNWLLLEDINRILCSETGLKPRRLQNTQNQITKALYFQGASITSVLEWLYEGAEIWNPAVRERMEI